MVKTMASSVSSRPLWASTPASRISRRPRSRLLRNSPDILENERSPSGGGDGLQSGQPPLDVLFRLGHVEFLLRHVPGRGQPLLLVLQPQQAAGVAFGEPVAHQNFPTGGGQAQQPQLVGHSGWGPAQQGGRLPPG